MPPTNPDKSFLGEMNVTAPSIGVLSGERVLTQVTSASEEELRGRIEQLEDRIGMLEMRLDGIELR